MAKRLIDVRSLARERTTECINVLTGLMRSPKVEPKVRVDAANSLLDRGWGKASAGDDAGEIRVIIRQIVEPIALNDTKTIEHDPQNT